MALARPRGALEPLTGRPPLGTREDAAPSAGDHLGTVQDMQDTLIVGQQFVLQHLRPLESAPTVRAATAAAASCAPAGDLANPADLAHGSASAVSATGRSRSSRAGSGIHPLHHRRVLPPARAPGLLHSTAANGAIAGSPSASVPGFDIRTDFQHGASVSLLTSGADPLAKPQLSFPCLIAMAMLDAEDNRLTVSQVYEWIKDKYPYFRSQQAGNGWKNSVRHNLSLNKHFIKQPRPDSASPGGAASASPSAGKGGYWQIRPESLVHMQSLIRKQASPGSLEALLADSSALRSPPVSSANAGGSGSSSARRSLKRRSSVDLKDASLTDAAALLLSMQRSPPAHYDIPPPSSSTAVSSIAGSSMGHPGSTSARYSSGSRRPHAKVARSLSGTYHAAAAGANPGSSTADSRISSAVRGSYNPDAYRNTNMRGMPHPGGSALPHIGNHGGTLGRTQPPQSHTWGSLPSTASPHQAAGTAGSDWPPAFLVQNSLSTSPNNSTASAPSASRRPPNGHLAPVGPPASGAPVLDDITEPNSRNRAGSGSEMPPVFTFGGSMAHVPAREQREGSPPHVRRRMNSFSQPPEAMDTAAEELSASAALLSLAGSMQD
eukprot:m.5746 g.5746  ORF g.5746 m.5746 type:complete len:606 (-) comp2542_c1_seq1:76-1893(-)